MKEIRFVQVLGPKGRTKSKPVKWSDDVHDPSPHPMASRRRQTRHSSSTTTTESYDSGIIGGRTRKPASSQNSQRDQLKQPPPVQILTPSQPSTTRYDYTTTRSPKAIPKVIPGRTFVGFTHPETLYSSSDVDVIAPKSRPPRRLPVATEPLDDVINTRKRLISESEHQATDGGARAQAFSDMLRRRENHTFDSPFHDPGSKEVLLVERKRHIGNTKFNGDWLQQLSQNPDNGKHIAFPLSALDPAELPPLSPSPPPASAPSSPSPSQSPSPSLPPISYQEAQETLSQAMAEACGRNHKPNPYFQRVREYFRHRKQHPPLPLTKSLVRQIPDRWPPGIYKLAKQLAYQMRLSEEDSDDTVASDGWLRRQLKLHPDHGRIIKFQLTPPIFDNSARGDHGSGGIEYQFQLLHVPRRSGSEPRRNIRAHNITSATHPSSGSARMAASSSTRQSPWFMPSSSGVTVPDPRPAPSAVSALKTTTPPSPPSPPRPPVSPNDRSSQRKRRPLQIPQGAYDNSQSMAFSQTTNRNGGGQSRTITSMISDAQNKRRRVEATSQFPESESLESIEEISPEQFPEPITVKRERLSMTAGDMGFPLSSLRLSLENRRLRRNSLADRQATLQNRSRRLSLRGMQAELHPSVPRDQFYRHLDPAALASDRFSQLLVWTLKSRQKEWESKPQLQLLSVRATGRSLITTILNNISTPVFDFERPPGQSQTKVRVANPKNDELRLQLDQCTQALKQVQKERDDWVRQLKQVQATTAAMAVPKREPPSRATMETPAIKQAAEKLELAVDAIAGISDEFAKRAHQQAAILDTVGYTSAVAGPTVDEAITRVMVPLDLDPTRDIDLLKHWHRRKVALAFDATLN